MAAVNAGQAGQIFLELMGVPGADDLEIRLRVQPEQDDPAAGAVGD